MKLLIVDDSPFVRRVLRAALASFGDVQVVGEAADGKHAEHLAETLRPDVITMDILMPMVGGMEAIEVITRRFAIPIVIVADVHRDRGALAMEALACGAADLFPKPSHGFSDEAARDLVQRLRLAVRARISAPPSPARPPRIRPATPPGLP